MRRSATRGPSLPRWRWALALLLIPITGLALACGDGGDDAAAAADVEAAVHATIDAWNAGDLDTFLASLTDAAILEEFEASREEAAGFLEAGDPPFQISGLADTTVDGDTATTTGRFVVGKTGTPERFSLVNVGGAWLIDQFEPTTGEAPDGATVIDLALSEFSFNFDASEITSADIAFNVANIGAENHFIDLVRVPADLDVEKAINSDEEPEGIVSVGGTDTMNPGTETVLFFTEPLQPGRYVMLCWVEAADGTPHAMSGMHAEFTIV